MANKHTSAEVKLEAVLQILNKKKSVREVADDLNLNCDTVNRWVNAHKEKEQKGLDTYSNGFIQSTNRGSQKVRELEKKLKEVELENEILKKFQAFLKENE